MKNISPKEAKDLLDRKETILIDVREKDEFSAEYIEGALLFPLSTIGYNITSIPDDKKIIFQCKVGGRSAKACEIYAGVFGSSDIYNMEGGIDLWKTSGFTVKTGSKR